MRDWDDRHRLLYLVGFWASFQSFSLQVFIPKLSAFLFNDHQLTLMFSIMTVGFTCGGACYYWFKEMALPPLVILSFVMPALFLLSLGFFVAPISFYLLSFLMWVPLGYFIFYGLNKSDPQAFYFADLIGGCSGLLYAYFSYQWISIESSLLVMSLVGALFFGISYRFRFNILVASLASCLLLIMLYWQLTQYQFNLIRWAQNIKNPVPQQEGSLKNGFLTLQNSEYRLLGSAWSVNDRVDIIETQEHGILAYSNNKLWTGIPLRRGKNYYPYLTSLGQGGYRSFLSLGSGGGLGLHTAYQLGMDRILGIELSGALLHLMREINSKDRDLRHLIEHTKVTEAFTYLSKTKEKFDVIENRYSDHSVKSKRYFVDLNFLRTQESAELVMQKLTPQGVGIWVIELYEDGIDPLMGNIVLAAMQVKGKRWFENIAIAVEKNGKKMIHPEIQTPDMLHILYSPTPWDKKVLQKTSNSSFTLNPLLFYSGDDYLSKLVKKLQLADNFQKVQNVVDEEMGVAGQRTLDHPVSSGGRWYLIVNFSLLFLILLTVFASAIRYLRQNRFSQEESWDFKKLFLVGSITGFAYGLTQALLIQEIEYFFASVTSPYIIVLSLFLIAGALASLLSSKKSIRFSLAMYCLLPLGVYLLLKMQLIQSLSSIGIAGLFFCYLVCISLLFPSLFSRVKDSGENGLNIYFLSNISSFSLGVLAFYILFASFGRTVAQSVSVIFLCITTLLVVILLFAKAFGRNKPEGAL